MQLLARYTAAGTSEAVKNLCGDVLQVFNLERAIQMTTMTIGNAVTDKAVLDLIDNLRCCGSCEPYTPTQHQLLKLKKGVQIMQLEGCTFTPCEVNLATQGEQIERAAWFERYTGWHLVDTALSLIFDRELQWIENYNRTAPQVHYCMLDGHLFASVKVSDNEDHVIVFLNSMCDNAQRYASMSEAENAVCNYSEGSGI